MSEIEHKLLSIIAKRDEVSNPDLVTVYDYWVVAQESGKMPSPANIDLLELENYLNNIYLFDVVDEGADHRCVYNGNFHKLEKSIVAIGETTSSLPESKLKDRTILVFNTVAQLRQPIQMNHVKSTLEGKEFQVIDILCLPLSRNGEDVSRTLTVMQRCTNSVFQQTERYRACV